MTIKEKHHRKQLIIAFILLFSFIPSSIVLIGLSIINFGSNNQPKQLVVPTVKLRNFNGLNPSDLLSDVLFYADKNVSVQGKVIYGEKSCVQRVCDENDNCCGCNSTRDLILRNISTDFLNQSAEIKIFGTEKAPLCQRKENSCDYDCGDWEVGANYNVSAKFVVVRPLGLTLSRGYLENYLEVMDKTKINTAAQQRTNGNIIDRLNNFLKDIFTPRGV